MSSPNSELKSEMRRMTVPEGLSNIESALKSTDGSARASSSTDPTESLSPAATCPSVTRFPLSFTPFVDFRSTIHQCSPRSSNFACFRDTEG
jgi:hypothetical protein